MAVPDPLGGKRPGGRRSAWGRGGYLPAMRFLLMLILVCAVVFPVIALVRGGRP
jgi:hypothetical protein